MDLSRYGLHPQRPERFDSSMLSDFSECPSKFYLRHVLGLRPKTDLGNPHLDWGTKWHDLMYAWGENPSMTEEEVSDLLEPWPSTLNVHDDRYARTKERMILLWNKYQERYNEHDEEFIKVLRREQFFDVECEDGDDCPLGGCGLRWCGRVDKLVSQQDKIGPWDYKTTGSINYRNYWERYQHGFQIPGYTWGTMHLTGEDVKYAYLDVMHVVKTTDEFARRRFMYTHDYLREWRDNVKRIISRLDFLLDNYLDEPDAWERNHGACVGYGLCAYAGVHFTPNYGGSTRWEILSQDFTESRWRPEDLYHDND